MQPMSLVVAGYDNYNLTIVSDTKLTYPIDRNDENRGLKNHVPAGLVEMSVLKSTIINETVCISFAGDREFADNALKLISSGDSLEKIKETLEACHKLSNFKTDFILCSILGTPEIYLIKNKSTEKVEGRPAWIGDLDAFNRFQKSRLKESKGISAAMDDVINDDEIVTVGGFKIVIQIDRGKFTYGFSMQMNREAMTISLSAGVPYIVGHGSAEKGAYTLTFIGSSKDYRHVAFHIKQGNFGVLYSRSNNGLLKPNIKPNMDEVDFHDYILLNCGINPTFSTQDRFNKFFTDGLSAYQHQDFVRAVVSFEKAVNEKNNPKRVEALFYLGVCLHYLKKHQKALEIFKQVISINPSYQIQILDFFQRQMHK